MNSLVLCLKIWTSPFFSNFVLRLMCLIGAGRLAKTMGAQQSSPLLFPKIERKAMIRNRYNYHIPPIRDIKGKETQTRNNWTLMETSIAESQTDSYFPTKWPNGYPKQKDVSDTHIQRRTITKINHDRRTPLERLVKSISLGGLNRFYVATILALTSAAV